MGRFLRHSVHMAMLPLKASLKEQRCVIVFSGLNNLAPTQFNQKCIQYIVTIIILLDRQCKFGVKSLFSRESVVEKKRPGRRAVLTSDD